MASVEEEAESITESWIKFTKASGAMIINKVRDLYYTEVAVWSTVSLEQALLKVGQVIERLFRWKRQREFSC